jgi:hypothetical protein
MNMNHMSDNLLCLTVVCSQGQSPAGKPVFCHTLPHMLRRGLDGEVEYAQQVPGVM